MQNLAFYNHKGGVGKTTSVINIAYFLQKAGKRVLVVDCDAQKNSFGFFFQQGKNELLKATKYENISLTTWDIFSGGKADFIDFDRGMELEKTLSERNIDCTIFDLPPAMTDGVREIIRFCDVVFVPTIIGNFEIEGLSDVTEEIRKLKVKLGGIFVTMFQKDTDKKELEQFQGLLKNRLLDTIIPYSKTVRESQKAGLSLEEYFDKRQVPKGNARKISLAYEDLTAEILERSGKNG
jgi:chromosome partitioning protein